MGAEVYETTLLSIVGTLFFLLIAVLAWIGSRVHTKIDALTLTLGNGLGGVNEKLGSIERDLRDELANLDRRITRVEIKAGVGQ